MLPFAPSRQRPRVLHCVTHLALGGAERVALTVIESLRAEFDFCVYAVRGIADGEVGLALKEQLHALEIPVAIGARIPMRFGGLVTGGIGLARAVRRLKPDLIHLHTEIPEASYAMMVALQPSLREIPLVRTIHNAVIWKFSPWLGRFCDRRMSHGSIAGVSMDAVNAFNALRISSGAGAPPLAPQTIYNGVAPVACADRPKQADSTVIRIVYGGRLEREKGTDLLPDIVRQTQLPAGHSAHLTLFGSGRHKPLLQSLALDPPAGWKVEVLPPIADFAAQLSRFDVVLLPSRYEGLSLVAVESFLAGIQVVATAAPGLREALPPEHRWVARVGDAQDFAAALQRALASRMLWPALAETGRAFAGERFNPGTMAARYRRLYEQTLALTH